MTNTSRYQAYDGSSDRDEDYEIDHINVIIPIADVLRYFADDQRAFSKLGLDVTDVIESAIAYAVAGTRSAETPVTFSVPLVNINAHVQAYRLIVERGRHPDEVLAVGPSHRDVHRLVDIIGEIAHHLTEALLLNLGTVPLQTRLLRFLGRDIILQIPTEVRRGHECNLARSNSRL